MARADLGRDLQMTGNELVLSVCALLLVQSYVIAPDVGFV
jgi:hypothetical protein